MWMCKSIDMKEVKEGRSESLSPSLEERFRVVRRKVEEVLVMVRGTNW